ncbi:phosphomevalonate kinase [Streptococcus phocae]|uniref:phosphomevalonate kinase n=1 Tax=Streptococcus phocae TaxID=119224 RepID=A0A0P6SND2_9STRE|nr:phosphomevalonate kinase [Streptococcus phocae]KPJ22935.1 phosphomevalonate kinase [Streptococcus phocae]
MVKYQVQTGGKLYLSGEYAILTPGQTALIMPIPLKMTAIIESAPKICLQSDLFDYAVDMTPDKGYELIQTAIEVFASYVNQTVLDLPPFSLSILGTLGNHGKKYGIGSSGSVTVLTLKALAAYYQVALTPDKLFKLASVVLLSLGDNGSMGDIACISYETLIAYTAFDRSNIKKWMQELPLSELLARDWGYRVRLIKPGLSCDFLVGWTQVPSLSKDMIRQVNQKIDTAFLTKMQEFTLAAISALETGNKQALVDALSASGRLLSDLSPVIYHPKLRQLVEACQGMDAVARSSGAGGGDCGIALVFDPKATELLVSNWQEADIVLLYTEKWR